MKQFLIRTGVIAGVMMANLFSSLLAQSVALYDFSSEKVQAYTPLLAPEEIRGASQVKGEDFNYSFFNETESLLHSGKDTAITGMEIGFNFQFAGETYDKFVVGGIGYIMLGKKGESKVALKGTKFQLVQNSFPRIGLASQLPFHGVDASKIVYKKEGSSPNRILSVEFSGMAFKGQSADDPTFRYQIKLYEQDNRIEILFDAYTVPEGLFGPANRWCLGLRDENGAHYRNVQGTDWSETALSENIGISPKGTVFPEGLKYTFSMPPDCEIPGEKIENVMLTTYSDKITVAVEVDTVGHAEGYLAVISPTPITENPDGKIFAKAGDAALGGTVLAVGSLTDFEKENVFHNTRVRFVLTEEELESDKDYYIAVYLYNYNCTNPRYTPAVTKQTRTLATAPSRIEARDVKTDEITFSVEPNAKNEDIVILMTTQHGYDLVGNVNGNAKYRGAFGFTPRDVKVGDEFKVPVATSRSSWGDSATNKVLYVGPAKTDIVCEVEMDENAIYYFGAASKGDGAIYGTDFANVPLLSPVKMPFTDRFENMIEGEGDPFLGWNGTKGFTLKDGIATATLTGNRGGEHKEACLTLPPMDFPEDSMVFFSTDYLLDPWNIAFVEGDSLVFELSRDGGKTFENIRTIHYQSSTKEVPGVLISGYSGLKQVVLRLRVVSYNQNSWSLMAGAIKVEAVICDHPRELRSVDEKAIGGNVFLTWNPSESKEQQWHFQWAMYDRDGNLGTWSSQEIVEEKSQCWVGGLEQERLYRARVRAVCGPGNYSRYMETDFRSGRIPSFMETFDSIKKGEGKEFASPFGQYELPFGFFSETYADYSVDETGIYIPSWYFRDIEALEWKSDKEAVAGISENIAVSIQMNDLLGLTTFGLPTVMVDKQEHPYLSFKMAYGKTDESGAYQKAEALSSFRIELWASVDSSRTYDTRKKLKVWEAADLENMDGTTFETVDLSEYEGAVSLLFGIYGEWEYLEDAKYIWIDSIGILNGCSMVHNLRVVSVAEDSAVIDWLPDYGIDTWLVKVKGRDIDRIYEVDEDLYSLTGLSEETEYEVSVSHLCGIDTADWKTVTFTTAGEDCAPVSDLTVSEIGILSAKVSWTGEAASYNLRVRKVSDTPTEWAIYPVEGTSYTLKLEEGTRYEGGVQSSCSIAVGDTSHYVGFTPFTTRTVTCPTPEEILVDGIVRHDRVTLKWTGSADKYQLEWKLRASLAVLGKTVLEEEMFTITDLQPNTAYEVRVRAICADGDTSFWSEIKNFETGDVPPCKEPRNLRVGQITENSALLSWDAEEDAIGFTLRYREEDRFAFDSVKNLKEKSYTLENLQPQSVYLWYVMAACTGDRYSGWSVVSEFTTEATSSLKDEESWGLQVIAMKNQLHLLNPSAVVIDEVLIYGLDGKLQESYRVNGRENVLLTTRLNSRIAIVEVRSASENVRFKVYLP